MGQKQSKLHELPYTEIVKSPLLWKNFQFLIDFSLYFAERFLGWIRIIIENEIYIFFIINI